MCSCRIEPPIAIAAKKRTRSLIRYCPGGRNEGKRDEPQVRLEEEGEERPRNPEEEEQDERNAYERAIPHRQSDGDLPPAKDEDHRFRRSSVDGFRKEGDGRLAAQRSQESEPDEERSERQAVEAVAIPIEPRDHAVVQLAKRRAVGGAGVAHGAGTSWTEEREGTRHAPAPTPAGIGAVRMFFHRRWEADDGYGPSII
jgi:hypothetical protein